MILPQEISLLDLRVHEISNSSLVPIEPLNQSLFSDSFLSLRATKEYFVHPVHSAFLHAPLDRLVSNHTFLKNAQTANAIAKATPTSLKASAHVMTLTP